MNTPETMAFAQARYEAAWRDLDAAQAAYHADQCEDNRAAYEAATWAAQAAVIRLTELRPAQ